VDVLVWIGIAPSSAWRSSGCSCARLRLLLFDKDDEDVDFDDRRRGRRPVDRSAAELEHDWWSMTIEALEALPAFADAVATLADEETDVDEIVTLSRDANGWSRRWRSRPSWSETTSGD
jgi:hypothetical protein